MPAKKKPTRKKPVAARKGKKPSKAVKKVPAKKKTAARKKSKAKPPPRKPRKSAPPARRKKPVTKKPVAKKPVVKKPKPSAKPSKKRKKSYTPKAGEKYMSLKQIRYFKSLFESYRDNLLQSAERMIDTMRDNVEATPDENDRASKEFEFNVALRGRDRERRLLSKIESAIGRLEDRSFGYCSECDEPIGIQRLLARPVATLCIECKNLQEEFERSGGTF